VWLMSCATHPSVTPCLGEIDNDLPSLSLTTKLYPNRVTHWVRPVTGAESQPAQTKISAGPGAGRHGRFFHGS
jgi:hypothetical protein